VSSYRRIGSVAKACEILVFLSEQKKPVSCQQIAQELDLPAGTAMCHLTTLEDSSFVVGIGNKFELGPRIPMMWAHYRDRLDSKINKMQDEFEKLEV